MEFSIVIPAYNAEQSLEKCLNSVRNQSFPDFEAIVVDDGSVDQTSAIAKIFVAKDYRFRYVHQENHGVSAARNHGVNQAQGKFVVFLDSDDQYDSAYLSEFHKIIAENPDCDHYWCGFRSVNTQGNALGVSVWSDHNGNSQFLDRAVIMDLHEKTLDAALWNKAYRKQILDKYHLRMDEELSLGEDLLFNFAYLDVCRTKIVVINRPLYVYTKAESGTLDSRYRSNLNQIYDKINNQLLFYLQKWSISSDQMAKYYSSVFFALERVLYNTYHPECTMTSAEKKEFNNELLKSEKFQMALKKADCSIHPLYLRAYKAGNWTLIMLLDELVKIKRKLMRK